MMSQFEAGVLPSIRRSLIGQRLRVSDGTSIS